MIVTEAPRSMNFAEVDKILCDELADLKRREPPSWHHDVAPLHDGGQGFFRIITQEAGLA